MEHYQFFQNKECEYFPCHAGADPESFNCLFCYCPLYALGEDCGGNCRYTQQRIKDCSACLRPHSPGGYEAIMEAFPKIADLAKKKEEENRVESRE